MNCQRHTKTFSIPLKHSPSFFDQYSLPFQCFLPNSAIFWFHSLRLFRIIHFRFFDFDPAFWVGVSYDSTSAYEITNFYF